MQRTNNDLAHELKDCKLIPGAANRIKYYQRHFNTKAIRSTNFLLTDPLAIRPANVVRIAGRALSFDLQSPYQMGLSAKLKWISPLQDCVPTEKVCRVINGQFN